MTFCYKYHHKTEKKLQTRPQLYENCKRLALQQSPAATDNTTSDGRFTKVKTVRFDLMPEMIPFNLNQFDPICCSQVNCDFELILAVKRKYNLAVVVTILWM